MLVTRPAISPSLMMRWQSFTSFVELAFAPLPARFGCPPAPQIWGVGGRTYALGVVQRTLISGGGRVRKREPDEPTRHRPLAHDRQTSLADEEWLVALDGPFEMRFGGYSQAVGVLANDDVALLQAEYPLSLDTEWPDARLLTGFHQSVPDRRGLRRADVNFVADFANEPHAQQSGANPFTRSSRTPR